MTNKRNALGKGLSALLEDISTDITSPAQISSESTALAGNISNITLDKIEANPFQPRSNFEEQALNELAASIREQGIIQPITVRKLGYDKFQIISGERRFRASQIAGLKVFLHTSALLTTRQCLRCRWWKIFREKSQRH